VPADPGAVRGVGATASPPAPSSRWRLWRAWPAPSSQALRASAFGGCGLDRAGHARPCSTIDMKGPVLLAPPSRSTAKDCEIGRD